MTDFQLRCPRCKTEFRGDDPEELADVLIAHIQADHGHAPPREHVLSRIERNNPRD